MLRISCASLILAAAALGAPDKDIVETAADAGSFKNLLAAAKFAGLAGALQADGPITVFAPADAAFERLPEATLKALLSDSGRPQLQRILKFHVVPGRLTAGALLGMNALETLNGQRLELRLESGRLRVGDATVTTTDLECRNGIIHVIDRVMLPEDRTIAQVAQAQGSFGTLVKAVEAAGLLDTLAGDGPFTVLAPTDEAFARLPDGAVANLLKPENKAQLVRVLSGHVIPGRATAAEAIVLSEAKSLNGSALRFDYRDGSLRVGEATVVAADLFARNGLIHAIDRVLLPPNPAEARRAAVPALLEVAIDRGVPLFNAGQIEACAAIYEVAATSILSLGEDTIGEAERKGLRDALNADHAPRERAWALRRAFDRILLASQRQASPPKPKPTAFQPIIEAPQPAGFPAPGPLGEIVVKRYPRYRMARAKGGMFTFGTLFQHIKKNRIEMTAPVEMTMEDKPDSGAMGQKDMAFLYASTDLGETGRDGKVEVVDVDALTVLSIGLRGPMSAAKLAEAKREIELRLKRDGEWKRAGEWRLMGYNSPMVPAEQRFYEVQLPVRKAE